MNRWKKENVPQYDEVHAEVCRTQAKVANHYIEEIVLPCLADAAGIPVAYFVVVLCIH